MKKEYTIFAWLNGIKNPEVRNMALKAVYSQDKVQKTSERKSGSLIDAITGGFYWKEDSNYWIRVIQDVMRGAVTSDPENPPIRDKMARTTVFDDCFNPITAKQASAAVSDFMSYARTEIVKDTLLSKELKNLEMLLIDL